VVPVSPSHLWRLFRLDAANSLRSCVAATFGNLLARIGVLPGNARHGRPPYRLGCLRCLLCCEREPSECAAGFVLPSRSSNEAQPQKGRMNKQVQLLFFLVGHVAEGCRRSFSITFWPHLGWVAILFVGAARLGAKSWGSPFEFILLA